MNNESKEFERGVQDLPEGVMISSLTDLDKEILIKSFLRLSERCVCVSYVDHFSSSKSPLVYKISKDQKGAIKIRVGIGEVGPTRGFDCLAHVWVNEERIRNVVLNKEFKLTTVESDLLSENIEGVAKNLLNPDRQRVPIKKVNNPNKEVAGLPFCELSNWEIDELVATHKQKVQEMLDRENCEPVLTELRVGKFSEEVFRYKLVTEPHYLEQGLIDISAGFKGAPAIASGGRQNRRLYSDISREERYVFKEELSQVKKNINRILRRIKETK